MTTISTWLDQAFQQLTNAKVPSASIDAQLILAHALGQSRTWLIAHQNDNIDDTKVLENASKLLAKRLERVPVAYLTNHKEFYGRSFFVDESVLIPRPESEMIIELLRKPVTAFEEYVADRPGSLIEIRSAASVASEGSRIERVNTGGQRLLDVGTGSGCLGITAKLEFPALSVTLSDISQDALKIARKNAHALGAKPIRYVQSDLLEHWLSHENPQKFDIIIANLPYVDREWERSPETDHEPSLALFADDQGLELIKKCVQQASSMLSVGGRLILEADPEQHSAVIAFASSWGLRYTRTDGYATEFIC